MEKLRIKNKETRRNEKFLLYAQFSDCKEDKKAIIEILEYDHNVEHDLNKRIESNVKERNVEMDWKFVYEEDTDSILTKDKAKENREGQI